MHLRVYICRYREEMQANAGSQQAENPCGEAIDQWIGAAAEYCRGMSAIIAHHLSLLRMEKRKRVHAQ